MAATATGATGAASSGAGGSGWRMLGGACKEKARRRSGDDGVEMLEGDLCCEMERLSWGRGVVAIDVDLAWGQWLGGFLNFVCADFMALMMMMKIVLKESEGCTSSKGASFSSSLVRFLTVRKLLFIVFLLAFEVLVVSAQLSNVISVAVGQAHTCVLVGGGINQAKCFGDDKFGELGFHEILGENLGVYLNYIDLGTSTTVHEISAGNEFTCAVLNNAQAKCWGNNGDGRLGLGIPEKITESEPGFGEYNAIGSAVGSMGDNLPFINLGGGVNVANIACGGRHVCALLSTSQVKCWGWNKAGQLGLGITNETVGTSPLQMGNNLPVLNLGSSVTVKKVAAGFMHTCALLSQSSQLKCWGANFIIDVSSSPTGQLGLGSRVAQVGNSPSEMGDNLPLVNVGSRLQVLDFALGYAHTCAIVTGQLLKCWGDNSYAELGWIANEEYESNTAIGINGHEMGDNLPFVNVGTGAKVIGVTLGIFISCALTDAKQVKCWGFNCGEYEEDCGQLGQGSITPQIPWKTGQMGDNLPYVNIGTGYSVTGIFLSSASLSPCALLNNGGVKCWGDNTADQLGLCKSAFYIGLSKKQMGNNLQFADDCGPHTYYPTIKPTTETPTRPPTKPAPTIPTLSPINSPTIEQPTSSPTLPTSMPIGPPSLPVFSVSVGLPHTCLIEGHQAQCFGGNALGELGIESSSFNVGDSEVGMGGHLPFVDLGTGLFPVMVSAGEAFTCAVLNSADVKCWGDNYSGELGLGLPALTPDQKVFTIGSTPGSMGDALPVVNLGSNVKVTSISSGGGHVCALLSTSQMKCWGANNNGQLGLGVSTDPVGVNPNQMGNNLPVLNLGSGLSVVKIATGDSHTCVLLAPSHQLKCFGSNQDGDSFRPTGQLGIGSSVSSIGYLPGQMGNALPFVNLTNSKLAVIDFALGYVHTCAIVTGGQLKCWGDNSAGELGRVDTFGSIGLVPSDMGNNLPFVDLGTNVRAMGITAGQYFTCALTDAKQVKCWGSNSNFYVALGQLGQGSSALQIPSAAGQMGDSLPYIQIGSGLSVIGISTHPDAASVCALLNNNKVKCWGENGNGQLGICNSNNVGTFSDQMGSALQYANDCKTSFVPTRMPTRSPTLTPTVPTNMPTALPSPPVILVAVGATHACFIEQLINDQQMQCFGDNEFGALGIQSSVSNVGNSIAGMGIHLPFVNLGENLSPVTISAGLFFTCAILNSTAVKCWGQNAYGQLGLGLPVSGPKNSFSVGSAPGSMGNNLPIVNLGLNVKAISISCGGGHVCALLSTSQAKCWGSNDAGQLGLGVHTNSIGVNPNQMGDNLPVLNLGTSVTVTKIAAGDSHTCVLLSPSHQLKCFGANWYGQLGLGIIDGSIGKVPAHMGNDLPFVNITNANLTVLDFSVGSDHTCAIVTGNQLKCWGDNYYGQLGNNLLFIEIGTSASEMGNNLPFVDLGTNVQVIRIAAGQDFTCALTSINQLKCWGTNSDSYGDILGQLGQGSSVSQIPTTIGQMGDNLPYIQIGSDLSVLAVFTHPDSLSVCALLNNKRVKCWGRNWTGQLGTCNSNNVGWGPDQMGNYLQFSNDCGPSKPTHG